MNTPTIIDEWAFHCEHCSGIFNINYIEIHGYPEDNPKITVCHGCYLQLTTKEVK